MRSSMPGLTLSGGGGGLIKAPGSRVWAKRQRGFQRVREGGSPSDMFYSIGNIVISCTPHVLGGCLGGGVAQLTTCPNCAD